MTFTEIQTAICDRVNLTSTTDLTRVGNTINRKYREITSSLGIKHTSRRSTVSTACSIGVSTLQFSTTEKVVAVFNRNVSPYCQLDEVTVDELRRQQPFNTSDTPTQYAIQQIAADTVTILLNVIPQTAFTLYADVYSTTATLSGTDKPVFSESYHDILVSAVLVEEYMKVEKPKLSITEEKRVETRMGELRLWIAVSTTKKIYQGKDNDTSAFLGSGGTGGGSGVNGALSYTQTGLITFDRSAAGASADAPFAVASGADKVANLDADKLDGFDESAFAKLADNETFTGNNTFNGTSAFVGNIVADVKFTDATFDIGKSAATRPRDGFFSRNGVFGGTLGVTGVLTPSALIDISGASAGQISFPATQNASAGANTLDDYKEGTWTPVLGGSGGTSGQTYTIQVGTYTKIGRKVTAKFYIQLSAKGTITTNCQIQGLPFPSSSTTNTFSAGLISLWQNLNTNWVNLSIYLGITSTAANLIGAAAAAATNNVALVTADITNTTVLIGSITYET